LFLVQKSANLVAHQIKAISAPNDAAHAEKCHKVRIIFTPCVATSLEIGPSNFVKLCVQSADLKQLAGA